MENHSGGALPPPVKSSKKKLDDNKQWMKHYIQLILYYTYVSVLLSHMSDAFVVTSVTLLFTVTIYKNFVRIQASALASESWY